MVRMYFFLINPKSSVIIDQKDYYFTGNGYFCKIIKLKRE